MKKQFVPSALLIITFLLPLPAWPAVKSAGIREVKLPDMVDAASKAIVNIRTEELASKNTDAKAGTDFFRRFFPQEGEEDVEAFENIGSGVLLDPKGLIVTNEHLISKALTIKVKFTNRQEYEASVIAADPELDMALLKIDDKKDFPFLPINKKAVRVGERAVVIGNPYGLSSSVTTGVISALGRNLRINNKIYANLIQTDAAINPGSSGGALLDAEGNLIGIVTAIYEEGKGIGFAIPIEDVMTMLSEFVENAGRRSIFGIFVERRKDEDGNHLFVTRIIPKSPAEEVGIRAGDRIIELDNKRIREGMKLQNAFRRVGNGKNDIKVIRGTETISIGIERIPPYMPKLIEETLCGIRLANIEGYAKVKFRLRQKNGVVVTKVFKGGIGERYGLKPGDVIVRINDGEVTEKKDFQSLMVEGLRRNYILYQVKRNDTLFFLPIKLDTLL